VRRGSAAAAGAAAAATPGEVTQFGAVSADYAYEPAGKRDPFRSIRWERPDEPTDAGPLEQFELEQLAVTAVVWESPKPRALVEDPSGRSYIIQEGTRMGKNEGRVIHIGDNLVLVKETYVDFAGDQTTKDVELHIRRSQGG
jgi:type IV pilus assembly protein PilP